MFGMLIVFANKFLIVSFSVDIKHSIFVHSPVIDQIKNILRDKLETIYEIKSIA